MPVDAYATESHYAAHLAPIWEKLGDDLRGTFWMAGALGDLYGGGLTQARAGHPPPNRTVMVASYKDEFQCPANRCVYVEHGSGQTYPGDARIGAPNPSYSGGTGHDRVVLFVCPHETVAARWRAAYPGATAVAVGCPKLDWWHEHKRVVDRKAAPVVALGFHQRGQLVAETDWCFDDYEPGLRKVAEIYPGTIGHAHPRVFRHVAGRMEAAGIEPVEDFNRVLARATLYAADNSSTLPEAASVGLPVLFLNATFYRKDIVHGGRFWNWPEGQVSCDSVGELPDRIAEALVDPAPVRAARKRMVASVYSRCDGRAADRAAAAIRAVVEP